MNTKPFSFLVAVPLCLSACGGLAEDPNKSEPLASISGTIVVEPGSTVPAAAHVALVWQGKGEDGWLGFNVAQDLAVEPGFPAGFELPLSGPPPASALFDADETFGPGAAGSLVAFGSVIAYDDKNGNGHLDLVEPTATSFVDGIVGANEELVVVWFPETPTGALADAVRDPQGNVPGAGFSLYHVHDNFCPLIDIPEDSPECDDPVRTVKEWLPIDASFELLIDDGATVSSLMCERVGDLPTPSSSEAYPAPDAPGLTCRDGGHIFTFETCVTPAVPVCGADPSCSIQDGKISESDAVPAGWPCPITP